MVFETLYMELDHYRGLKPVAGNSHRITSKDIEDTEGQCLVSAGASRLQDIAFKSIKESGLKPGDVVEVTFGVIISVDPESPPEVSVNATMRLKITHPKPEEIHHRFWKDLCAQVLARLGPLIAYRTITHSILLSPGLV